MPHVRLTHLKIAACTVAHERQAAEWRAQYTQRTIAVLPPLLIAPLRTKLTQVRLHDVWDVEQGMQPDGS